jgi:hypothetical protein
MARRDTNQQTTHSRETGGRAQAAGSRSHARARPLHLCTKFSQCRCSTPAAACTAISSARPRGTSPRRSASFSDPRSQ